MSRLVVKIKPPLPLLKNVSFMQNESSESRTFPCIRTVDFTSLENTPFCFPYIYVYKCSILSGFFFFFWGNKGSILSDLSLSYPLLRMPTTATSSPRRIQDQFSDSHKYRWHFQQCSHYSRDTRMDAEPALSQGSLSFVDGESTIAFQVPRPTKGLVHQGIVTLPQQVSFSWNVNDTPISWAHSHR